MSSVSRKIDKIYQNLIFDSFACSQSIQNRHNYVPNCLFTIAIIYDIIELNKVYGEIYETYIMAYNTCFDSMER